MRDAIREAITGWSIYAEGDGFRVKNGCLVFSKFHRDMQTAQEALAQHMVDDVMAVVRKPVAPLLFALNDIEMPDGSGDKGMPCTVEDAACELAEAIEWDSKP